MKNRWGIIAFIICFTAFVFVAAWKYYGYNEQSKINKLMGESYELFIKPYSPQTGSGKPKVELVEFLDPECESCSEFSGFVKELLKEFKDDLRLTIRYAPFHGNSKFAIKVLEGAKAQGKYWECLELLFKYQPYWGDHHHPRPELIWQILKEANVDIEKIKAQMGDPAHDKMIESELQDVQTLEVRATPTFFVNGEKLRTFSRDSLKKLIESKL